MQETETISAKVKKETGMPAFPTPIQYTFGIPSQSSKTRARHKGIQIGIIPLCR
jgi:hypothetical protein